jgi:hypothetical protein
LNAFLSFIAIFDGRPFMLPPDEKGHERISAALYDASMVAIDQLWNVHAEIGADAEAVRARMAATLAHPDQLPILTGQGNTANAVKERISLMKTIFRPE